MRVKAKVVLRGAALTADPGAVVEVSDVVGAALLKCGAAERVEEAAPVFVAPAVEMAEAQAAEETALAPEADRPKRGRRG